MSATMVDVSGQYLHYLPDGLHNLHMPPPMAVNTAMEMSYILNDGGGAQPPPNAYYSLPAYTFPGSPYRISKTLPRMKVPDREDWERHRPKITRLYRDERWKLKDVAKHMLTEHGFKATERMYKKRIFDWDIRRNLNWDEREAICNSTDVNGEKNTTVVVRGQERQLALFQRHLRQPSRAVKLPVQGFVVAPKIRATMYPPGNRQTLEMICKQTLYACEVSSNELSHFQSQTDTLWNLIDHATRHVHTRRYADARLQLDKAGEWLAARMKDSPDFVLISVIECLRAHSRGLGNGFNTLELFYRHARDLSLIVLGPTHPLTQVLAHLPGLDDWADIAGSAYRVAIDTIRRKNAAAAHGPVTRLLQLNLTYILLDAGNRDKVEELLVEIAAQSPLHQREQRGPHAPRNERAAALAAEASQAIKQGPENLERAERLLEEARRLNTDPVSGLYYPYTQFLICGELCYIARIREQHERAIYYFKMTVAVAVTFLGEDDMFVYHCRRRVVLYCERVGAWAEAEELEKLCRLAAGMHGLTLDEAGAEQEESVEAGEGAREGNGNMKAHNEGNNDDNGKSRIGVAD